MKKSNLFLVIVCALAMGVYIFFVEFQFGISGAPVSGELLLQAVSQ